MYSQYKLWFSLIKDNPFSALEEPFKMCNWYLVNYKKEGEKSLRVLTENAKNEMFGPSGPPLCTYVYSTNILD